MRTTIEDSEKTAVSNKIHCGGPQKKHLSFFHRPQETCNQHMFQKLNTFLMGSRKKDEYISVSFHRRQGAGGEERGMVPKADGHVFSLLRSDGKLHVLQSWVGVWNLHVSIPPLLIFEPKDLRSRFLDVLNLLFEESTAKTTEQLQEEEQSPATTYYFKAEHREV